MPIVDLRQISSRQLEPLLLEEARHWRDDLRWDNRSSLDLIKKFVDARSLLGCAALQENQAAGYAFYVIENHKGLLGGLYVSPQYAQLPLARQLLGCTLEMMRGTPGVERIEAQLVPFGCEFDPVLAEQGFRLYPRKFMLLDLRHRETPAPPAGDRPPEDGAGLLLERWSDRRFNACARLIQLAYANHMDGEINDQYRTQSGALKFLKNIIVLPGCGQFQEQASFVLRPRHGDELAGAVLTSAVAPGIGHTTQICIMPGYQHHGLGQRLMEATIGALQARRFSALSLTVTAANERAVLLYTKLGFLQIKTFTAGVWRAGEQL